MDTGLCEGLHAVVLTLLGIILGLLRWELRQLREEHERDRRTFAALAAGSTSSGAAVSAEPSPGSPPASV